MGKIYPVHDPSNPPEGEVVTPPNYMQYQASFFGLKNHPMHIPQPGTPEGPLVTPWIEGSDRLNFKDHPVMSFFYKPDPHYDPPGQRIGFGVSCIGIATYWGLVRAKEMKTPGARMAALGFSAGKHYRT